MIHLLNLNVSHSHFLFMFHHRHHHIHTHMNIQLDQRPKIRVLNAHKDLEHRFSNGDLPRTESNTIAPVDDNETTSSDEDPSTELKIQAADMPPHMQKTALQSTIHALRTYTTEKHIAESVKQNFDQLYEPTWHCIVGRNWGSCVTHTKVSDKFIVLEVYFN